MCIIEIEDGSVVTVPKFPAPRNLDDNLAIFFDELNAVGTTVLGRHGEQWLARTKVEQSQLATVL